MATNTLVKFGVALGAGTGRGGQISPKLAFKFRVRFFNFGPINGGLDLTQQIQTCGRPSRTFASYDLHSYNSVSHGAGKPAWSPISVSVYDDITNDARYLVDYQLQKQGNAFEQTTPAAGINYKFTMLIENMDGGDVNVLDSWYLEGCWLSGHTESENSYLNTNGINTIGFTVTFDNATQLDNLMPDTVSYISGYLNG